MSAHSPAALVRRFIDEAWNQGRVEIIPEIMAEPYQSTPLNAGVPPLPPQSHAQLVAHVADFRKGLPDLSMRIEELIEASDRVFVQTRLTGTHTGPLMGIPPTGRRVDAVLSAVYFSNGERLTSHRVLVDFAGLMQQLGVAPPPGPGGPSGPPPPR